MSDHTTQGGTDWELKEAENAIVAAGHDPAALAVAQRRHAEAIRNMMQTALVPSFERAVTVLVDTSAAHVIASIQTNIDVMTALVQQGITIARDALKVSRANAAKLVKVEKDVIALKKGQADATVQFQRVTTEIADLRAQIIALNQLAETANVLTEETNRLSEETNRLSEEHNRVTVDQELIRQKVADLELWRSALEARGGG